MEPRARLVFLSDRDFFCRCGHCKRLKPEFAVAAGVLNKNDPPVALVKVDCTEAGKSTCEQFSVSGYPTLKIFRKGELSQEYNGPRESSKYLPIIFFWRPV